MSYWPWLTTVAVIALALSPLGRELYHGAFVSGEQLARSLAQFMLMMVGLIAAVLVAVECTFKWWWRRRRTHAGQAAKPGRG